MMTQLETTTLVHFTCKTSAFGSNYAKTRIDIGSSRHDATVSALTLPI